MSHSAQPQNLRSQVHQSLRSWHKIDNSPENLISQLMIIQAERAKLTQNNSPETLRMATNRILLSGLQKLGVKNEQGADILRQRFHDQLITRQVAHKLNFSEYAIDRLQAKAITELAEIIWSMEVAFRHQRALEMAGRLPPPTYTALFGIDKYQDSLSQQLLAEQAPWVVAIVGIGGIGKTALADKVARLVIEQFHFEEIAVVHVRQHSMSGASQSPQITFDQIVTELCSKLQGISTVQTPQKQRISLHQRLKEKRHLIIIDNLEEAEDTAYLLEHIQDWANPSKFIITSRIRPTGARAIATHNLSELNQSDSIALIRHEAQNRGLHSLADAQQPALNSIYELIGGNPHAIKLTVRLAEDMPMPAILSGLRNGHPNSTAKMYEHIYRKAWQTLSPSAQDLLESMPLSSEGGVLPDQMKGATGLSDKELWPVIRELSARSLIEVRGTVWERHYGIHQLTETFLHTNITGWSGNRK